jgi:adenylate cyclase
VGDPDFPAAGLLDGLDGPAREARAELLGWLHERGVTLDELREAIAEDRLALLPIDLVLRRPATLTGREVAERAGVELDRLLRQRRAAGLAVPDPDERAWTEEDVQTACMIGQAIELGMPEDQLVEVTRVFGEAAARSAAAVHDMASSALAREGDTERDLGMRLAGAADALHAATAQTLGRLYEQHFRELIRNDAVEAAALAEGRPSSSAQIGVAFCDLVGFTPLGEAVPAEALGDVAGRLARMAADVASPPVRLVKTIGDAAMLVSPDPAALLDASLGLVEAAEAEGDDFPALRAGIATGEAIARAGDWYGRPVNLAARICGVARPGSVLTTAEVREAAGPDAYRWSRAGRRRLKGVSGETPLWRARPADGDGDDGDG